MSIQDTAIAAANDGDGFFIHRTADTTESYVGIGDECGDFMLAAMTADRMRAVAALLLAEAQHLEDRARAVPPLGVGTVPSRVEYCEAKVLFADGGSSDSERATARTVIAEYEAANR